MLDTIRSEVESYVNLDRWQKLALIDLALENVNEILDEGLDPNIEAIVYQLANEIDDWYDVALYPLHPLSDEEWLSYCGKWTVTYDGVYYNHPDYSEKIDIDRVDIPEPVRELYDKIRGD